MLTPEQIALEEEHQAYHDYMHEAYFAEAAQIAHMEQEYQWCMELDAIFERYGYKTDHVDVDAALEAMKPLHPNHPFYVELETFLANS